MTDERLSELLDGYLEDRLDREGVDELSRLLASDAEARRAFVRIVDQERSLQDLLTSVVPKRRPAIWLAGGAVAAAAAIALLVYAISDPTSPPPSVVRDVPAAPRVGPAPLPPPQPPPVPEPKPEPRTPEKPAAPTPIPAPPPPAAPAPAKPIPPAAEATPQPVEAARPGPKPERKETVVALAKVEGVFGQAFSGQIPLQRGQEIFPGQGVETGGGESGAIVALADGTRLELRPETAVNEIMPAGARRVSLRQGTLVAAVPKAGPTMTLVTPHAEVAVAAAARLALTASEGTRLEVKEGRAKLLRVDDKAAVEVGAGHYAVAQKGVPVAARRLTRGWMLPEPALWAEDFQDPREVEKDWQVDRGGLTLTYQGPLDVDLRAAGDASLSTRGVFGAPLRVSVDVEVPSRLRGSLVALRLHSRKDGKDLVHCDLDEQRYYLMTGPDQSVTADATRRGLRRERWSVELHADGSIVFSVDGKDLLRSKRAGTSQDLFVTLLVKSRGDAPAGTHVRFDNVLLERIVK